MLLGRSSKGFLEGTGHKPSIRPLLNSKQCGRAPLPMSPDMGRTSYRPWLHRDCSALKMATGQIFFS